MVLVSNSCVLHSLVHWRPQGTVTWGGPYSVNFYWFCIQPPPNNYYLLSNVKSCDEVNEAGNHIHMSRHFLVMLAMVSFLISQGDNNDIISRSTFSIFRFNLPTTCFFVLIWSFQKSPIQKIIHFV